MEKLQKKIYEGKQKGYTPIYADKAKFCAYIKKHVSDIKKNKIFGYSFKGIRNKKEIKSLELKKGMKVLDAGCGGGILLNQLKAAYGIKGYGIDLSMLAIRRARECGDKAIIYKNASLIKIPYKTGSFDAIVSFDVLEHVKNKEKVLSELIRVLKPGGKMLVYAVSKNDFFTWHWFLRIITFGKYGHDSVGGHFRENFAMPVKIKKYFKNKKAGKYKLTYMHSFFTLLVDEILFKMVKPREAAFAVKKASADRTGNSVKKVFAYRALCFLYPIMEILEMPWKLFALSNGFFIRFIKD